MRLTACLVVLLGGCSSCDSDHEIPAPKPLEVVREETAPPPPAAPTAPAGSVCELMSVDEVTVMLGGAPDNLRPVGDDRLCAYTRGDDSLMLNIADDDAAAITQLIAQGGTEYVEVPLVGAKGWRRATMNMFVVQRGQRVLVVAATGSTAVDGARVVTVMKSVASRIAP